MAQALLDHARVGQLEQSRSEATQLIMGSARQTKARAVLVRARDHMPPRKKRPLLPKRRMTMGPTLPKKFLKSNCRNDSSSSSSHNSASSSLLSKSTSSNSPFQVSNADILFFDLFFDLLIAPSIENSNFLKIPQGAHSSSNLLPNFDENLVDAANAVAPPSSNFSALPNEAVPMSSSILSRMRLALFKHQVFNYFLILVNAFSSSTPMPRPEAIFNLFISSAHLHGINFN